ncbi:hypothetical protein BC629DRAFT_222545 [Irpex lacteus]|nr:hypothetical protein BC629DRAFT_222545 [Irpex lacteus]
MFTACGLGVCGRYDRLGLRDTVEKRHPYLELLRCSTQASNTTVSGKGNSVATYPRTSLPESALVLRELIVLKYISSGRARPLQATNPSTTPSGTRNRLLALIIKVHFDLQVHTTVQPLQLTDMIYRQETSRLLKARLIRRMHRRISSGQYRKDVPAV